MSTLSAPSPMKWNRLRVFVFNANDSFINKMREQNSEKNCRQINAERASSRLGSLHMNKNRTISVCFHFRRCLDPLGCMWLLECDLRCSHWNICFAVSSTFLSTRLTLCDKLKLTKTKLFVHANTIKCGNGEVILHWASSKHSVIDSTLTMVCLCVYVAFVLHLLVVDRLMTKLCSVKSFSNTTMSRDASVVTHSVSQSALVLGARKSRHFDFSFLLFGFVSVLRRQSELMNWRCSFCRSLF